MTPDPDSDGHRIGSSTWMRWRLIWRVHYGIPAALALVLWAVSVPLTIIGVERYTARHAALADQPVDTAAAASGGPSDMAGTTASAAASTASAASSATQAMTALAAALAAGDVQLIKALPSTAQRGADLGALISAARNAGLVPSQADYALETGTILGLARLRVDLPVRGSDAQLTRFMAMLDAQLPNAVVESLVVRRARPLQSSPITANLHLVLFYRAPA